MLLQKQQLVESLRLQLEGKRVLEPNPVKKALPAAAMDVFRVTVKEEVMEVVEDSEMVTEPQVELEQQRRIVMRQNQRNLLQQTHQRKRKTQKQQRQVSAVLSQCED